MAYYFKPSEPTGPSWVIGKENAPQSRVDSKSRRVVVCWICVLGELSLRLWSPLRPFQLYPVAQALSCKGQKFNNSILNSNKFRSLLLLGGQICGDGVWWVNWFIFLSAKTNRPRVHKVLAVRLTSHPFRHIWVWSCCHLSVIYHLWF